MIDRTLRQRLKRLEQVTIVMGVQKIWQIVILHSDGRRSDGPTIEWPRQGSVPTLSERFAKLRGAS